jgi:hypothetical protein
VSKPLEKELPVFSNDLGRLGSLGGSGNSAVRWYVEARMQAPPLLRGSCVRSASASTRSTVASHAVYQLGVSPSAMTFSVSKISPRSAQLARMCPAFRNVSKWNVQLAKKRPLGLTVCGGPVAAGFVLVMCLLHCF